MTTANHTITATRTTITMGRRSLPCCSLQSLTWIEWGLLGTVLVCTAIVLSRAIQSVGGKAGPTDEEHEHVESTAARRLANLEVRLYDFTREVEAGLEKRVVELNTLVAAADKEIMRLTDLLKNSAAGKESPASQVASNAPNRRFGRSAANDFASARRRL